MKNMNKPRKSSTNPSTLSMESKIRNLQLENRATPKVGPTRYDPKPIAYNGSLWIERTVMVSLAAATTELLVSDLTSTLPSTAAVVGFKILKISVWNLESRSCAVTLGNLVMTGNLGTISYRDIAPLSRLSGVCFNIPDSIASSLTNAASKVLTGMDSVGTKVVHATVRFQI